MAVELQIKGLDQLTALMEKYPVISERNINNAIKRALVRIFGQEKQQAPVHTGFLRDNWSLDFGRFQGRFSSNSPYALAVHEGTGPHFVSGNTLQKWAAKKGLNPWAVAKNIAKYGTKANPFLQRAVDLERENINGEFKKAIDDSLSELTKII